MYWLNVNIMDWINGSQSSLACKFFNHLVSPYLWCPPHLCFSHTDLPVAFVFPVLPHHSAFAHLSLPLEMPSPPPPLHVHMAKFQLRQFLLWEASTDTPHSSRKWTSPSWNSHSTLSVTHLLGISTFWLVTVITTDLLFFSLWVPSKVSGTQ